MALHGGTISPHRTRKGDDLSMDPLPTLDQAVRRLTDVRGRIAPVELHRLSDTSEPGIYAWFVDAEGAGQLEAGLGMPVDVGLIYAGQAGAGNSHATLGSRIRGNHLGSDIYGSTFRLTLASALRTRLALEPIGGGHMSQDGEERLTNWMRQHLMVSVIAYPDRVALDAFETVVLERLDHRSTSPNAPRRRFAGNSRPCGGHSADQPLALPGSSAHVNRQRHQDRAPCWV